VIFKVIGTSRIEAMMNLKLFVISVALFISACQPGISRLRQDRSLFGKGKSMGRVDSRLKEASGLICSLKNNGMLWVVNDGGNDPSLFLINALDARIVKEFPLKIPNRDWEALTVFYDSASKKSFLFIGDIGDNMESKKSKVIYWLEEPDSSNCFDGTIHSLKINLESPADMETMMVDPKSGDLFLFSKRADSITVYSVKAPFETSEVVPSELQKIPFTYVVDATISARGEELLMKDYKNVFYWKRHPGQSIIEALSEPSTVVSYKREIQGEALCFDADSKGFFTLSESWFFKRAKLFYYERREK
jgi:hypothetical protein